MYGNASNNELTIDVLLPELASFQDDELKNPNGFTTTFDSTALQQNYVVKDNDESDDEEDQEDQNTSTMKYKKTKIRAILIQDEKYKEISSLRVLKFVEALDDEMQSVRKILPETKDKNYEEEVSRANNGEQENDEYENSDRRSNSDRPAEGAAGENGQSNDKMKRLKDAKTLISEKNVPKSIRFLQRVGVIALIGWLITACVNLAMSFSLHSEISEGVSATLTSYYRYDTMANINYQIRKLQIWATFLNTSSSSTITTETDKIRANLATLIDDMQALQFDVIKAEIKMEKRMSESYNEPEVIVESLLSSTIKYDTSNLTDALFTYLSQASSVRNSSLSYFVTSTDTQTTLKNFYYVRRNGLGSLRNASENTCDEFYSFYAMSIKKFRDKFLILALVAICIVLITNSASIPIISSLHQTNKKVLSMFGYIPTDDINGLAIKCERYIRDYLEDRSERRDFSFDSDENSQASGAKSDRGVPAGEQEHSEPEEDQLMQDGGEDDEHLYEVDEMGNPIYQNRVQNKKRKTVTQENLSPKGSRKPSSLPKNAQDVKLDANDEDSVEKEKVEEIHFTRSQKLLNSRKNQNKADIMKFVILSATYIAGSIIYFVYQNSVINDNTTSFNHLKLIAQSIPQIRYINVYTLEELAQNDLDSVYNYWDGKTGHPYVFFNSRQYFLSAVQKNEQEISTSSKQGFPGSFNSYKNAYSTYSTGDLCTTFYTTDDDQTACEDVMDGLLGQGLKVAVDTIISNSIDIMSQFYASDRYYTTQVSFISSTTFSNSEAILDEIYPALDSLLTTYTEGYTSYNDKILNISRIWFSLAVFYLFFTGLFLFWPYMNRLRDDIWRTKGMLNMIPMELIYQNENLSHLFTSDELTKAVQ